MATLQNTRAGFGVLAAVIKKELLIFVRYPSWIIAVFLWPLMFPVMAVFSAKALAGPDEQALQVFAALTGTPDYTGYIVVGLVMWMWLNMTLWTLGSFLRAEQMRGTLEATWLCPVSRLGVLLGATVSQLLISVVNLTISVIALRFVWGLRIQGDLALTVLMFALSAVAVYGIGIAFASLVMWVKEANAMVFLVRGLFLVFCGMTYPLAVLPGWMRAVSHGLPLTYAIDGIRAVALVGADAGAVSGHMLILLGFAAATLGTGFVAFRWTERQVLRTGALGHH